MPDLRITQGEKSGIVEVKGHQRRQTNRKEVLQLLGYQPDTKIKEKSIVVSNPEFEKKPSERSKKAFTDGAIELGLNNDISLVSSVNLYEVVIKIIEKNLDNAEMQKIRDKIMSESGLVWLD